MVRMKKGKNWPCAVLEESAHCAGVGAHLFIVVVIGSGHCERRSSREVGWRSVSRERRKETPLYVQSGRMRCKTEEQS